MPQLPCPNERGPRAGAVVMPQSALDDLDGSDGLVVLVVDPITGAADTYGPFGADVAQDEARRRRLELDDEELDEVVVYLVRHHRRR